MPNGKPGDHPYTDIVTHGLEVFTEEVDALVRELARHPRLDDVDRELRELLYATQAPAAVRDDAALLRRLRALRARLD